MHRIAVISDTHNLLRPEVIEVINTCEVILHAGDISTCDVLDRLRELKPLHIVRGNNDRGDWAADLPHTLTLDLFGRTVFMTHIKRNIPQDPETDLVIYGHSHRYSCTESGSTVFLNPGSCGPRRFNQDITMAVLTLFDEWEDPAVSSTVTDTLASDGVSAESVSCAEAGLSNLFAKGMTAEGIFFKDRSGCDMCIERIDISHGAAAGKSGFSSGQDVKNVLRTTLGGSSFRNSQGSCTDKRDVTTDLIRKVCGDVDREKTVEEIAIRRRIDPELAGQIVRMYLTHQKVTPDQIMTKLGL